MDKSKLLATKGEGGFTLVELAVVMIIIGLLIGGVLKGQELIANAQITATASAVKGIDAAATTFRDSFAALPGDISNPATRLTNCGAAPCSNAGDGNSRVDDDTPDVAMTANGENEAFFVHLGAADLISGIDINLGTQWGGFYPSAPILGGFHVGFDNSGALGSSASSRAGHYLVLTDVPGAAPGGTALSANQAARIDRKLDDGVPDTGTVFEEPGGAACLNAGEYDESNAAATCDLYIRFQN